MRLLFKILFLLVFSEKQDSSRNYNYCLDGQKLVLKNSSDTYGQVDTEYKTEIDSYSKIKREKYLLEGGDEWRGNIKSYKEF